MSGLSISMKDSDDVVAGVRVEESHRGSGVAASVQGDTAAPEAMSRPGAATNCPVEGLGLQTTAAAVAGLGVTTSCRRTPSKGVMADRVEASLPSSRPEVGLQLVPQLGAGDSQREWGDVVGVVEGTSQVHGSL